jgi:hypothetical protein
MNKYATLCVSLLCLLLMPLGALAQNQCMNQDTTSSNICINSVRAEYQQGKGVNETKIKLEGHFVAINTGQPTPDFWQVRFSQTTGKGMTFIHQDKIGGKSTEQTWETTQAYLPGAEGPPYSIAVQYCNNFPLGPAMCSKWATVTYTPRPPDSTPRSVGGTGQSTQPTSQNK